MIELKKIIESVLFASIRPLRENEIADLIRKGSDEANPDHEPFVKIKGDDLIPHLEEIKKERENFSVILQETGEGWQFGTHPDYAPWCRQISDEPKPTRLSQPALETLAVIAYRQPISRSEIEAIRGVAAGGVLETLLEREVVRVAGRADVPGRPLLYETTPKFLEHFGLRSLGELPNVEELKRVKLPEPPAVDPNQQPELIHAAEPANEN